jgi:hypothetical protein
MDQEGLLVSLLLGTFFKYFSSNINLLFGSGFAFIA